MASVLFSELSAKCVSSGYFLQKLVQLRLSTSNTDNMWQPPIPQFYMPQPHNLDNHWFGVHVLDFCCLIHTIKISNFMFSKIVDVFDGLKVYLDRQSESFEIYFRWVINHNTRIILRSTERNDIHRGITASLLLALFSTSSPIIIPHRSSLGEPVKIKTTPDSLNLVGLKITWNSWMVFIYASIPEFILELLLDPVLLRLSRSLLRFLLCRYFLL